MDRRRFLVWLGGTAAGVAIAPTLDLERLLWVPGAKTILLPPVEHWNTLITPDWVTREAIEALKQNLAMAQFFDREYDVQFDRYRGRRRLWRQIDPRPAPAVGQRRILPTSPVRVKFLTFHVEQPT